MSVDSAGRPVPATLEVRGLTAGYGRTPVLRGLDLDVASGVTAVLGSSGCGKTSLLRAVAGDPSTLQIMYSITGARRLTELELGWLPPLVTAARNAKILADAKKKETEEAAAKAMLATDKAKLQKDLDAHLALRQRQLVPPARLAPEPLRVLEAAPEGLLVRAHATSSRDRDQGGLGDHQPRRAPGRASAGGWRARGRTAGTRSRRLCWAASPSSGPWTASSAST